MLLVTCKSRVDKLSSLPSALAISNSALAKEVRLATTRQGGQGALRASRAVGTTDWWCGGDVWAADGRKQGKSSELIRVPSLREQEPAWMLSCVAAIFPSAHESRVSRGSESARSRVACPEGAGVRECIVGAAAYVFSESSSALGS